MRLMIKPPQGFSNETVTERHFSRFAINQPEVLAQVSTLFKEDTTPFSSLLAGRGSITGTKDVLNKGYKIVGSREVRWGIEGAENQVGNIIGNFVCEAYPNEPGKNQSEIIFYADTDWFSPRDVLELADRRTFLYLYTNKLPRPMAGGIWEYRAKLVTDTRSDFVNPNLLAAGMDFGIAYNMYEELSETAYEKYNFHEMTGTHMTIMRMKWSMSGTAEALKANTQIWMMHNGAETWVTHAEMKMLKRFAEQRERYLIDGRSTVDQDGKTIMRLETGIEVTSGDGLMNQGDGVWRMPYNGILSTDILDTVMSNMRIASSMKTQNTDVALVGGQALMRDFQKVMKAVAGVDPKVVVESSGSKGVDLDYEYYKFGGIRIFPIWHRYFDRKDRPGQMIMDNRGNSIESHRGIFVSLGDIDLGKPQVDLLALGDRGFKMGTVQGINRGGDMANSVDGRHDHVLAEFGIANRDLNGVAELYMPYTENNRFYVNRR